VIKEKTEVSLSFPSGSTHFKASESEGLERLCSITNNMSIDRRPNDNLSVSVYFNGPHLDLKGVSHFIVL